MQTQRITLNDLEHGQVRIPRATKVMFPDEPATLDFVLRGQSLSTKWDPRLGPDQERSGVLRVGKGDPGGPGEAGGSAGSHPQRAGPHSHLNVPPKTAGEEELFEFARAFNGYEHWGENALQCFCEWEERFLLSGELPEGPADLRAALFLAWRAYDRGGGPGPFSEHGSLTSLFYAALERLRKIEEVLKVHTRLRDGSVLEVMTIDWPHPHEPAEVWHRFRGWKNGATPIQLERARQQILASKKYLFRCKFCQEICNTGHRYSEDICQGCPSERFGVVY